MRRFLSATLRGTPGRLPGFLVIGAHKSGTTALHQYLGMHPQIDVSWTKELNYFVDESELPTCPNWPLVGRWQRGIDWYRRSFPTDREICGEASPHYALGAHSEPIARKMAAVVPEAKLVFVVRHPLERARSHYLMAMKLPGARRCSFAEFLGGYHAMSFCGYGSAMRCYLRHYSRERILVIESADLDLRRRETLGAVFRFLGVDGDFWCSRYASKIFVGARRPIVSPLGERIRDSAILEAVRSRLSPSVSYTVESLLLSPFRTEAPSLALPPDVAAEVVPAMRAEMDLLRELAGQPLPSLEVSIEDAIDPRSRPSPRNQTSEGVAKPSGGP